MPTHDEELREALEEGKANTALLRAGTCPQCGQSIESSPDENSQRGYSSVSGVWWNYKCSHCGYVCDLIHPDGAPKGTD